MARTTVILGCMLVLWTGISFAQTELQPGQTYAGGTEVTSTDLGVSLTLPAQWPGAYHKKGEQSVLVLGSDPAQGHGMVVFLRNHSSEQVKSILGEVQNLGDGMVLTPDGAVKTEAGRMSVRYLGAERVGRALALEGPQQKFLLFFFVGGKKDEARFAGLLEGLAASTRFTQPPVEAPSAQPTGSWNQQWTKLLFGMMLRYFSRYNSGGGGMTSDRTLHLCKDQRFAYFVASSLSMDTPGATAGGGGTAVHKGRWQISEVDQYNAVLNLTLDEGLEETLPLSYDGEKIRIGDERWFRVESDVCR